MNADSAVAERIVETSSAPAGSYTASVAFSPASFLLTPLCQGPSQDSSAPLPYGPPLPDSFDQPPSSPVVACFSFLLLHLQCPIPSPLASVFLGRNNYVKEETIRFHFRPGKSETRWVGPSPSRNLFRTFPRPFDFI